MQQNLLENMDYIFFVYGLAFVLLAGVCLPLMRRNVDSFPWLWLGLFGLVHGINEWLDMIAVSQGDNPNFAWARIIIMTASFFFLLEFGRRGLSVTGKRVPGFWMHIPLLALACLGVFAGAKGFNAAARYAIGFPGIAMSTWALLSLAQLKQKPFKRSLTVAALSLGIYSISSGLIVPNAGFFPNTILNQEMWLQIFHFPIQLLRAILACVVAMELYEFYSQNLNFEKNRLNTISRLSPLEKFTTSLAILLAVGWVGTQVAGQYGDKLETELDFMQSSEHSFAEIDRAMRQPERVLAVLSKSKALRSFPPSSDDQLEDLNALLDRYAAILPDTVIYVLDTKGLTLASTNRNTPESFLGKNYAVRPYFKEAMRGEHGHYFAMGLTSSIPGYYVSQPLFNANGDILGVLALKANFDDSLLKTSPHEYRFLTSPEGAILSASHKEHNLRALWPIPSQANQRLLESKQFPTLNSTPLLSAEPENGADATLFGQKFHVIRQQLSPTNWSIVSSYPHLKGAQFRLTAIFFTLAMSFLFLGVAFLRQRDTEQKAALAESEQLHRNMFEKNLAIMLLADPENASILGANAAAREFYGYSHAEFQNMKISKLNVTDETDIRRKIKSIESAEGKHYHTKHKTSSGSVRELEVHATYLMMNEKPVILAIIHDISDRIKAENEREIAQTQLLHSSRLASIGTLASGVAHEINNPLNLLLGYLSELEERPLPTDETWLNELMKKMEKTVNRAAAIVKGLRMYARPVSDEVENTDIHKILLETIDMVKGVYGKQRVSLHTKFGCLHPVFFGSGGKIQQVILNLIANAKDAVENNPEDKRHIEIRTHNEDNKIVVAIADNGHGIQAEHLPSIFDPFFTTKGPGKGTGLGLSISQSIINAMGGEISVESAHGKGTTFYIRIPAAPLK